MNCHKQAGALEETLDPNTTIERGVIHITLYDKALLLETERPGIVTDNYAYLTTVMGIIGKNIMRESRKGGLTTTREKIKAYIEAINVEIKLAKDLRDLYQSTTTTNNQSTEEDQDTESEDSSYDEDEDPYAQVSDVYYTAMKPPSPLVKEDDQKKCSLCYHSSSKSGTPHKFSIRGNIEVDACPLLAPLSLGKKEEFLNEVGYCKTCLYRKDHGECKPPPELNHLQCGFPGCRIRWAVCAKHKQENLTKLERRKSDLASHGILWIF